VKIELKKRYGIYLAVIGVIVLIVLRFFAFNSGDHMNHGLDNNGQGQMGMEMEENNSSNLNANEYMFAEMMISHHQQAVEMSNLALTTSKNAKVLDLAQRIKDAQSVEIVQMQSWLGKDGSNQEMNDQMGHDMGGIMSEADMAILKSSTGATFDKLFLEGMIAHHEGALSMVTMINETSNQEVDTFGLNVIKVQTAEIAEMKQILASL
jgi:uncharacterized protein (DUF305 family)